MSDIIEEAGQAAFKAEVSAAMVEGAEAIHKLYLSLVEGGFTEAQALRMLGIMLANSGSGKGG